MDKPTYQYEVSCVECEEECEAKYEKGDFICTNCGAIYDGESNIIDLYMKYDCWLTYSGAVKAGYILTKDEKEEQEAIRRHERELMGIHYGE